MNNHMKTSWFLRSAAALALPLAVLLSGCLPEYEELPLTATGEGGESLTSTASSGSTSSVTPTCSGAASGSIPGSPNLDGQIPCTLQGSIDARNLTPSQRTQVAGIKVLKGTLTVASAEQIGYLKALTSVDSLTITNFSGPTLELPARIAVTTELVISGGNATTIKGFGGLTALAGQLSVINLNGLGTIDAFGALTSVGQLNVQQLPALTSLKAFGALTAASTVSFVQLSQLPALPSMIKLTSVNTLSLAGLGNLGSLNSFPALASVTTLSISGLNTVATVAFPALKSVNSLSIDGMAKLSDLEGFGAQLQVKSQLFVCNILMKADQREIWRQKHAPNLQFGKCANGCIGMGC
jgi:hypothetical protein